MHTELGVQPKVGEVLLNVVAGERLGAEAQEACSCRLLHVNLIH